MQVSGAGCSVTGLVARGGGGGDQGSCLCTETEYRAGYRTGMQKRRHMLCVEEVCDETCVR
jgi:hypothetical protein